MFKAHIILFFQLDIGYQYNLKKEKKYLTEEVKSVEYAARHKGGFINNREDKLCGHSKLKSANVIKKLKKR
jgi:hypothetical protein